MSFDRRHGPRWQDIIRPAIEAEPIGGLGLKAVRVDIRRSGDSILTDIADGIAHSQLVLADISVRTRGVLGSDRGDHDGLGMAT